MNFSIEEKTAAPISSLIIFIQYNCVFFSSFHLTGASLQHWYYSTTESALNSKAGGMKNATFDHHEK